MLRNGMLRVAVLAGLFLGAEAMANSGGEKTVLVIPSRYRVVQFAQDIARIRPVYLVAYGSKERPDQTALFLWEPAARDWKEISADEFSSGSIFDTSSRRLVIVGADRDVPADLPTAPQWAESTAAIASLYPADMANELNRTLSFSHSEWRWLARRYGLTITDTNAERRRYGKYGPPGSKPVRPPPAGVKTAPPAAPLVQEEIEKELGGAETPEPVFDIKMPPAQPAPVQPKVEPPPPPPPPKKPQDK